MTQKEKELLLKDLSARLSYDVKVQYYDNETKKLEVGIVNACMVTTDEDNQKYQSIITTRDVFVTQGNVIEDIKPYLFPLSSMTEEQKKEEYEICKEYIIGYESDLIDFYNRNHIDYRGLIAQDLAIDATGLGVY